MKKLLLILVFCLNVSLFAQEQNNQSYSLKGVFKTSDSSVIGGMRLEFKNNGQVANAYTDVNGEFEAQLSPGRYELTITKSISDKFIAFINIQQNGLNPSFVEFVVEPNPNFCGLPAESNCPKALSIIKPAYPAAARAVRVWGEVVVAVKIDKDGKVVAASAESGHPLLKGAAERAALDSKFEPSEKDGDREAKITYVFFPPGQDEKVGVKRYLKGYRIEIFPVVVPLDYTKRS